MQLNPLSQKPTNNDYPKFTQTVGILFCRDGVIERGVVHSSSPLLKSNVTQDGNGKQVFVFGWFPHVESPNYGEWLGKNMSAVIAAAGGIDPTINLPGSTTITPKRKIRIDEDIPSNATTKES